MVAIQVTLEDGFDKNQSKIIIYKKYGKQR